MNSQRTWLFRLAGATVCAVCLLASSPVLAADHAAVVKSARTGSWGDAKMWQPARVPKAGDRVVIQPNHRVTYNVESDAVIRSIMVAGVLSFDPGRDTLLNVGIIKVHGEGDGHDEGHDDAGGAKAGEAGVEDVHHHHHAAPKSAGRAVLEVGAPGRPIPAGRTARIRLHYIEGMKKENAPAIVCRPGGRMEFHGAPMSRTWVKLGGDVKPEDQAVTLAEPVTGWRVGDEVIVTGSNHEYVGGSFRDAPDYIGTERRRITKIDGQVLTLDAPLKAPHAGTGQFRSEVANLSRSVIVESAKPDAPGGRGHTMYHRYSSGSISYARFAHLGKEGVLGRYPIHFHLVKDSMRGSSVVGAAVIDSGNRWVTVHGTQYLVVRDCVGYQSVGHGYFLEDGTEVYNVLDRNLAVQAYHGPRMKGMALPFDPNDGAGYWWANGRNTFVRNVSCENDEYGYRYDSQKRSNFDSHLPVRQPDGTEKVVDIRTLPFYRFQHNESHTEGLYSFALAGTDGVGPDTRHPHVLKDILIWQTHYALRVQLPTMWIENVTIDHAAYGVYRPWYENHVYRNLRVAHVGAEPFNRGLDDRSTQHGSITVDGLHFVGRRYGRGMPFIQMSDNNVTGKAESHFRNVTAPDAGKEPYQRNVKPLVNRGGGAVVKPKTPTSVPVILHDHYGKGRHARIVSTEANDFGDDGRKYEKDYPLTGREAAVTEVTGVEFPKLLDPVDDQPPATIITWPAVGVPVTAKGGKLIVRGTTTDNTTTRRVRVNGVEAKDVDYNFHQWQATLTGVKPGKLTITAGAEDNAGNKEQTPHVLTVMVK